MNPAPIFHSFQELHETIFRCMMPTFPVVYHHHYPQLVEKDSSGTWSGFKNRYYFESEFWQFFLHSVRQNLMGNPFLIYTNLQYSLKTKLTKKKSAKTSCLYFRIKSKTMNRSRQKYLHYYTTATLSMELSLCSLWSLTSLPYTRKIFELCYKSSNLIFLTFSI